MNYSDSPANLIHRRTAQRDRFRRVARQLRTDYVALDRLMDTTQSADTREYAELRSRAEKAEAELAEVAHDSEEHIERLTIERDAALWEVKVLNRMVTIIDMEGEIQYFNLRRRAEQEIEVTRREMNAIDAARTYEDERDKALREVNDMRRDVEMYRMRMKNMEREFVMRHKTMEEQIRLFVEHASIAELAKEGK